MDEMGKNLVKDKYPPEPAKPGQVARQGLAHNVATIEELCRQVQSWQDHRNQRVGTVNWQFRTADARIKLKRLYPVQPPDALPPGPVV
jgi:hypothetical protein